MSYRNIDVDGVQHKYTVGETHVKVKGMQAAPKEKVGHVIDEFTVEVHPAHVRDFIKANYPKLSPEK